MPFDGTEMFTNPLIAKLWEVECMLATEEQWCKGHMRDREGRHCLVGALAEVNARQDLSRPILRAIREVSSKHYWRIESFNDDPATNHQDILRVLQHTQLVMTGDIARADEPPSWYGTVREAICDLFSRPLGPSIPDLKEHAPAAAAVPDPLRHAAPDSCEPARERAAAL